MSDRRNAWLVLAAGLAALYCAVFWLVSQGVVARAPALMGAAATIDLTVTAALATWWLAARRGLVHRRAPFVVLALGFVAARLILPANAREGLVALRLGWAAIEFGALLVMVAQLGKIRRRARALAASGAAPADTMEQALAPAIGALSARLIATELSVIGYALGGWWRATPPDDARTFSMHRRAHYAAVAGVFVFLIAGEAAAVHLFVARWSTVAAWLCTASSLWVALWLVGDAHALRLQPLRLAPDGLVVRLGIRWRAFIPYDAIAEIEPANDPKRNATTLAATVLNTADVQVSTVRPLQAKGLFGRSKSFNTILLSIDRPTEFIEALRAKAVART